MKGRARANFPVPLGILVAMPVPIYVVDAFASRPFAGNPAAVCLLDSVADPAWMQRVAAEMRHAETSFVRRRAHGFDLRWFTPLAEVDLCGHATLAASRVLWDTGSLRADEDAVFHTKSGDLTCTRHGYGIQMDFPAEPLSRSIAPSLIHPAIGGIDIVYAGANRMDLLVEVADADAVRRLEPRMHEITALDCRGVIVTAESDHPDFDFVSRFFAPAVGVPEDPVTGSAHCCLGPYWAEKLGKSDLVGYQCSERGGTVRVGIRGERVQLQGDAVIVLKGELLA